MWDGISTRPPLFFQIYLPLIEQNYCTPSKCCELSEYPDSAHTEVEHSLIGINLSLCALVLYKK